MKPGRFDGGQPADATMSVAIVRRVDASVALAFAACTDPKWLVRWLVPGAGTIRSASLDLRPGGSYRLEGIDPDGAPYQISGCYIRIDVDKCIIATWNYEGSVADLTGPPSKIRIDLRPLGRDACEITLTHKELNRTESSALYRTVWSICLDRLAWASAPNASEPEFSVPLGAIADLYGDHHRSLQDAFETQPLANRLRKVSVSSTLDADARTFIEGRDMVFLTTVDHRGFPTCSYKGGAPGFVRIKDEKTLVLPSYDGNGMFLSAGNVKGNPKIGMLFIDFERPHRIRIHGVANLVRDKTMLDAFPGAELLLKIKIIEAFVNCPRYVHRYQRLDASRFVPSPGSKLEVPLWKNLDFIRDAVPSRDNDALEASGAKPITRAQYLDLWKKGQT
jgi:uncharacterized protein YndB with AHSA1/START domain/predicted pyridoxine 5'-phosphate oxidase superfamily flavin-nucleotide-binding protein